MRLRMRSGLLASTAVILFVLAPRMASAVTFDWVVVGDPGNASEQVGGAGCFGAVPYTYWISRYEVTNSQYVEFLNAKAASDPLGLYSTSMDSDTVAGGIARSGSSGGYSYAAKAGFENKPATYVDFYSALRFTNWLSNGQGSGATESGSYTLLGGTPRPTNYPTLARSAAPGVFLTSQDEWYKAAYFDGSSYFDFPTGANTVILCMFATLYPNRANCAGAASGPTPVGGYPSVWGPYETYDQGGNVMEWLDTDNAGSQNRFLRGGSWQSPQDTVASNNRYSQLADLNSADFGFRVSMQLAPGPTPIPTLGPLNRAVVLLALMLVGAGWIRVRRVSV